MKVRSIELLVVFEMLWFAMLRSLIIFYIVLNKALVFTNKSSIVQG